MSTLVIVSGGFDPVHIGHLRYLMSASSLGQFLLVIINNDNWLRAKKGYVFMPQAERREILSHFYYINEMIFSFHEEGSSDASICRELRDAHKQSLNKFSRIILANGGDRQLDNIPEKGVCEELGIEMVFNVGGEKIQSSSKLVARQNESTQR